MERAAANTTTHNTEAYGGIKVINVLGESYDKAVEHADEVKQYILKAVEQLSKNIELRRVWRGILEDLADGEVQKDILATLKESSHDAATQDAMLLCKSGRARKFYKKILDAADGAAIEPERLNEIVADVLGEPPYLLYYDGE